MIIKNQYKTVVRTALEPVRKVILEIKSQLKHIERNINPHFIF